MRGRDALAGGSRYNCNDHDAGTRAAILNTTPPAERPAFELERYLPYRIAQIAAALNAALAREYAHRFALTMPEWRVMTVLAERPGLSAAHVARRTGMDKVAVSRAVASLTDARRVERTREESDRRRSSLQLTARGWALYNEVVPWSLAYEYALVRGFTPNNRQKLDHLLEDLLARARGVRADRVTVKKV